METARYDDQKRRYIFYGVATTRRYIETRLERTCSWRSSTGSFCFNRLINVLRSYRLLAVPRVVGNDSTALRSNILRGSRVSENGFCRKGARNDDHFLDG